MSREGLIWDCLTTQKHWVRSNTHRNVRGEGDSRDSGDGICNETVLIAFARWLPGAASVLCRHHNRLSLLYLSRIEGRCVEESEGVASFLGRLLPFQSACVSFVDSWIETIQASLQ